MENSTKITEKEYGQIHTWLRENHGRAFYCSSTQCESNSSKFEWALKVGERHSKSISNYVSLCMPCHRKYDKENNNNGHKVNKWCSIKVPESTWYLIKISAANSGKKIYEEVRERFK